MENPLFESSVEKQNNRTLYKCFSNNLKDSLVVEGFQIYGLKGNELFGAMEGPLKTSYENGYFLFKIIILLDNPYKLPELFFSQKCPSK